MRIVVLLMNAAANVDAKNVRGLTPLELAQHNMHDECIAVLAPHTTGAVSAAATVTATGASAGANASASATSGGSSYGAPQTPTGQQAMRQVYNDQASMEYQPHAGWGGMSERGAQAASFSAGSGGAASSASAGVHVVSSSERAGYDANMDPGLARLMAAVSTPGRGGEEDDEEERIAKLESIVSMGKHTSGGTSGAATTMDPTFARLAAAVAGTSPTKQQQQGQQQQHWVSCQDPTSGSMYFKELATGHTQWEPPSELVNQEWRHEGGGVWMNVRTKVTSSGPR